MQVTGSAGPPAAALGQCSVAEQGQAGRRAHRHIRHLRHQHHPGRVVAVVVEQHAAQAVGQDVVLPLRATRACTCQRPRSSTQCRPTSLELLSTSAGEQQAPGVVRPGREDPSQRVGHLSEGGPQPEAWVWPELAHWLRRGGRRLRLALQQLVEKAHRLHLPGRLARCALWAIKQARQPGECSRATGATPTRSGRPLWGHLGRLRAAQVKAPAV